MILEDLYRGKYAPIESMAVHNDHAKLTQLQQEILAALPEEKKGSTPVLMGMAFRTGRAHPIRASRQ